MRVPTITVDRGGNPVVINQRDFRPGVDRVWKSQQPISITSAIDETDELLEKLRELGIRRDRRTSIEKLRRLYEEAISK